MATREAGKTTAERQDIAITVAGLRRTFARRERGLRRSGDEIVALDGLHLTVPRGEVHGLLGPNGAGKSTLCKILATVLLPTAGSAAVLGYDVARDKQAVRRELSLVLGGERGLYYRLTARQNLRFWGALYGLSGSEASVRADALLERVGLATRGDDRVEKYSRGMKQRLHLARGLLSDPSVLLLDEPTTGLDPVGTREFHALMAEVRQGRTVLLATHDMAEAEKLCDRVSIIDGGKVVASEAPAILSRWITQYERVEVGEADDALLEKVRLMWGVGRIETDRDGRVRIETVAPGVAAEIMRLLLDHGHTDVRTSMPSLEEVYVHVLGDGALDRRAGQSADA